MNHCAGFALKLDRQQLVCCLVIALGGAACGSVSEPLRNDAGAQSTGTGGMSPGLGGESGVGGMRSGTGGAIGTGGQDASVGGASGQPDAGAPDSATTAVPSDCRAILRVLPSALSGLYTISPTGTTADAFETFCDMTTDGGGWTKVTKSVPDTLVTRLRGSTGRQMLKCTDQGTGHIISPPFGSEWKWAATSPTQVPGTWIVNGAAQSCGNDPEYTTVTCGTWWGVGCGNGPGITNKLFPGVLDQPSPYYCADSTSAHTNLAFSICGPSAGPFNYRSYSVFVRSDQ